MRDAVREVMAWVLVAALAAAAVATAQTKDEAWDASGARWQSLSCSRNSDDTVECSVCLSPLTSSLGAVEQPCSRPRVLRATNTNRIDAVANALIPSALRQARFDVDAGAP